MTQILLICAAVLLLCSLLSKLSDRFGVPSLLLFMVLGMLFGSDGIFKIPFDNYAFAEMACSTALIFIMFGGGFDTNWKTARPVALRGGLLSVFGVIITAGLTGLFCTFCLGMELLEGLLIGAVIGSTDAASVFAILRGKKLNLKSGLAPMLELESGSNDPTAYTLTVMFLSLLRGGSAGTALFTFFSQLCFGTLFGFAVAGLAMFLLKHIRFPGEAVQTIFMVAAALGSYALPGLVGGNGYLSVYITGIILGNCRMANKAQTVHFFESISNLMQIVLFFLLGLLAFPSRLPSVILPSVAICLFMSVVARPAAVFAILAPFRHTVKEKLFVSFAGLRGAAAIVFAIFTSTSGVQAGSDLFHIVFCLALLSVALQGSLLPAAAKKLRLVDEKESVLKTFTDYEDSSDMRLLDMVIGPDHPYIGRPLSKVRLLPGSLVVMIKRGGDTIIPSGSTVVEDGDQLILNCLTYHDDSLPLTETEISPAHPYVGKTLKTVSLPDGALVVLIKRAGSTFIPKGSTCIEAGDVLVTVQPEDPSQHKDR